MLAEKICKLCFSIESITWWKCCPDHCTEDDVDVICLTCLEELHPICLALNAQGYGEQQMCGYDKDHEGRHTWERVVEDAPSIVIEADIQTSELLTRIESKMMEKIPDESSEA